jgi:omega-amidase
MQDLQITYLQSTLHWENPEANRKMFGAQLDKISAHTDLLLLPEMFNTGFSMKPEVTAEAMDGPTVSWMKEMASRKSCVIAGSMAVKENGKYFNRMVWMRPDGTWAGYDKRHLFRYGNENNHYVAGDQRLIVDLKGWKICPLICYDLRFPVWARNSWTRKGDQAEAAYDLLIYAANWPEVRSFPWKSLLTARAIENQTYVVGVNRVGEDGNQMSHSGDSAVYNFKGEILSSPNAGLEMQETISLSYANQDAFRRSFPAGLDADGFTLD